MTFSSWSALRFLLLIPLPAPELVISLRYGSNRVRTARLPHALYSLWSRVRQGAPPTALTTYVTPRQYDNRCRRKHVTSATRDKNPRFW